MLVIKKRAESRLLRAETRTIFKQIFVIKNTHDQSNLEYEGGEFDKSFSLLSEREYYRRKMKMRINYRVWARSNSKALPKAASKYFKVPSFFDAGTAARL